MRRAGRLAIWDQPERRSGIPALDGLRAIAVALVLAGHGGIPGVTGGFIGVDVFFVLSGFLITSLLLDELGRCGRIELTGFWIRRARRLLPALVLMV
ncbi:MAG TPA: acyltransferase, partial [Mycobacterium sp.]|nr:acyltransferase [Mycobacterium sp.]